MRYYYLRYVSLLFLFFCSCFGKAMCFEQVDSAENGNRIMKANELLESYERMMELGEIKNETVFDQVKMTALIADTRRMLNNPNASYIGNNGHYCGPAVILNWVLNNRPEIYTKAVLELSCYGKTQISEDSPVLKTPKVLQKSVDFTITDTINNKIIRADIDSTSLSDFILAVSLVCSEKFIQKIGMISAKATHTKPSVGCFILTNTFPWEMNDYFRKLGINIEQQAYYLGDKEKIDDLLRIENAVKKGKMPIIFDNHLISYADTKNFLYKITGAHFITIHSFKVNRKENTVDFTFWDYGMIKPNPYLSLNLRPMPTGNLKKDLKRIQKFRRKGLDKRKKEISIDEFLKGMKGYWIPEKQPG